MCSSVVLLKGTRFQTGLGGVEEGDLRTFPLYSRNAGANCLCSNASIESPMADAMPVVPEPGESTKKVLSPYTIWSSPRESTSLQNCDSL